MANKRAVLAVVSARPAGDGVGYSGLLLARALQEITGHEPRVIALEPATPGTITRREQLAFLSRLTIAQRTAPPLPVVFNHVGIARAQLRVPRALRRPFAVLLHGIEAWDPNLTSDRRAAVSAAAVRLSNSRFTARRVGAVYPDIGAIAPCPLALLPEAAPATSEDDADAIGIIGAAPGPCAAIIGRMSITERYKGHDELIESWSRLRGTIPAARLFIVGRGDDSDRLRAKARASGVGDAVVFTGYLRDGVMRALLARCTLFAMPSRGEGFGLAYLEAMRSALPCIGSDADAAPEVIEDGKTGRIVPAGNGDALVAALTDLLGTPQLAKEMGQRGRQRERDVFSFSAFRDRVSEALRSVSVGQSEA